MDDTGVSCAHSIPAELAGNMGVQGDDQESHGRAGRVAACQRVNAPPLQDVQAGRQQRAPTHDRQEGERRGANNAGRRGGPWRHRPGSATQPGNATQQGDSTRPGDAIGKSDAIRKSNNIRQSDATRHAGPQRARGMAYAALDLGTNNCRLLIAEPGEAGFRVVDAFSRIVRLGEGLGSTGALGEGAIQRSIDALRVCSAKMDNRQVARARLVATEACRSALNGADFIDRVLSETGLQLEVVDRRTEAFLAVSGCASLADPASEALLVFDIGGGSTEVACLVGRGVSTMADPCQSIADWVSLPVGVVTLAERYGGATVTPTIYRAMVDEVETLLEPFRQRVGWAAGRDGFHLLGTSGTVTTIAGVHLRLPRYDRRRVDGLWMSDRNVNRVVHHLRRSSFRERAANACIGRDRADLVLAGCAILDALRQCFPAPRLRIADRGLREGILMSMMREDGILPPADVVSR